MGKALIGHGEMCSVFLSIYFIQYLAPKEVPGEKSASWSRRPAALLIPMQGSGSFDLELEKLHSIEFTSIVIM